MARFDLNLLSALHALISEKNVTRAAEQLNVTQPTMSGMLQRLRYQFDDQLLVRNGRRMELTPFAASLVEPVRQALRGVEVLMLTEPMFDPATSTREFRMMASDYSTSIFLPHVVAHIANKSPGIRLIVQPLNAPVDRLISSEIDLCITADDLSLFGFEDLTDKLHSEPLFTDEFVCVVANDHPLENPSEVADILNFPHVGVEMVGAVGTIDAVSLRRHAPMFRPNFMVAEFSLVPFMVAHSHLIGVIQSRLAEMAKRMLPIRTFRPPYDMPSLLETMFWHPRHIEDPGHAWLRGVIREVADTWLKTDDTQMAPQPSTREPQRRRAALQAVT
jgi:LysR family transcriptional regulator, nod-box dependent transcriptional activator